MTVNAEPLDTGAPVVAEPALRVRADHPAAWPAVLRATRRSSSVQERARAVRALERAPLPAVRRRGSRSPTWPASTRPRTELAEVVDFLRNPDKLPPARRPHPARRAALGAARHRQDAACACRRRRGRRALLLALRLRVRRGDRRRRRRTRARPLQGGRGGRTGDPLHRRARRGRPLPHLRGTAGYSAAATTSASRRSTRSSPRWTASTPTTEVIVLARHQPPRGARPGAAAPRPLRPPRRRAAARPRRPRGDPQVHVRNVPLGPDIDLGRIAATTPGMVGADLANLVNEAALLAARRSTSRGHECRLHRRARAHRARRRAQDHDQRDGAPPHRLPRGRPRDRRHAHAGSRPGAQDLDHPPRPAPRRHVLGPGRRPLHLLAARARRQDQGRARRPRRRGDRLRRHHHRRRVRHPAAHRRSHATWSAAGA